MTKGGLNEMVGGAILVAAIVGACFGAFWLAHKLWDVVGMMWSAAA